MQQYWRYVEQGEGGEWDCRLEELYDREHGIKALYPSIDIDFAAEKCVEIIIESSVQFENVNTMELGLYLSLTMSVEDLREQNILEFCARRKRMVSWP